MDRISAAGNLTIEMNDERWRLLANGESGERVLVEAMTGRSLRYVPRFAQTRRLPGEGILPTSQVRRVILGWSPQDEAWHLGLLLGPELAEVRGSRWCEVASWPDPQREMFAAPARRAGESLALVMQRPFYVVPTSEPGTRATAPRPMPALPLAFDQWTFEQAGQGNMQLVRDKRWSRERVRRAIWYLFWVVVYIGLSALSLTSPIAPPNPAFLPLLGLLTAVILVVLAARSLYQALMTPNCIVIDPLRRHIRGLTGERERWRYTAGDLRSVYISQVVSKKRRSEQIATHYHELNLHLRDGQFRYIMGIEQTDERPARPDEVPAQDAVLSLDASSVDNDMQAVGVYIAQALGVLCWYDQRVQ